MTCEEAQKFEQTELDKGESSRLHESLCEKITNG